MILEFTITTLFFIYLQYMYHIKSHPRISLACDWHFFFGMTLSCFQYYTNECDRLVTSVRSFKKWIYNIDLRFMKKKR